MPGFIRLQFFLCDDLVKILLFLLFHINAPIPVHHGRSIDCLNESLNQVLFATKLNAGVDCSVNGPKYFFILAVRRMIFPDQPKSIVNIDLDLTDQLDLELDIIVDVFLVAVDFRTILLIEINLDTLIVLKYSLR